MRTLVQLVVEVRPIDGKPQSAPSTAESVRFVRDLVASSVWYPEHPLEDGLLASLIDQATKGNRAEGLRHEEALAVVERLIGEDARDGNRVLLAANTLVLLSQVKHGLPLTALSPSQIIPLHDGIEECWGIITVQKSRVDLRVRSEDIDRLEEATERALVALNIHAANSPYKQSNADSRELLLCTMEAHPARELSKDGTESRTGRIHVLGRFGRAAYIASRPLQLTLAIAALALLVVSLVMEGFEVTLALTGWFVWWHSLIDKLFTTALWAAVLAYAGGVGEIRRHPHIRTAGKRVIISWKR
ncbi:hypothetical protein [Sinomonas sp. B1-1]|uniref:hypothetical protein n=1 Tax=Sinomonas sp. B1-1 TaxID=3141454 RepID=UPI003D29090A